MIGFARLFLLFPIAFIIRVILFALESKKRICFDFAFGLAALPMLNV
jgi:hypothetical protein